MQRGSTPGAAPPGRTIADDIGHLLIGGVDPAELVRRHRERIVPVHLEDVDAGLAASVRDGELSLIADAVKLLEGSGHRRWVVLEQDTAITGNEPPVGHGPVLDVGESIEFLQSMAPGTERVHRS